MLDNIIKLANKARESENWPLARTLSKIAVDVALVESNEYLIKQFKIAQWEAENIKAELKGLQMNKLSEEVDIIARDLESQVIQFEMSDPLEAVLDSYKLLHRVAGVKTSSSNLREVLALAEDDSLSDDQLAEEIQKKTMGYTLNDKKNLLYVLEKDYNVSIPLEKIAKFDEDEEKHKLTIPPKTEEDKKKNREIVKKILEEEYGEDEEADKFKWKSSFPSAPSIWSGFAYEAIVPYQQHNQLNYWSLASKKDEEILNKIAKIRK